MRLIKFAELHCQIWLTSPLFPNTDCYNLVDNFIIVCMFFYFCIFWTRKCVSKKVLRKLVLPFRCLDLFRENVKYPPWKELFMKTWKEKSAQYSCLVATWKQRILWQLAFFPTPCQLLPNGQSLLILSDSIAMLISIKLFSITLNLNCQKWFMPKPEIIFT